MSDARYVGVPQLVAVEWVGWLVLPLQLELGVKGFLPATTQCKQQSGPYTLAYSELGVDTLTRRISLRVL